MKRGPHELDAPSSKRSQKRSSSSVSESLTCRYHGCDRPCYPKAPGMCYDFCGVMHADMFMAEASDSAEYDIIRPDNEFCENKKCKLSGCENSVAETSSRQHDFCCISHVLEYLTLSTAKFQQMGRLCKIENCFRHVYVGANGRIHDFCGLKHAKLAAAAKGAGATVIRVLPEERGEEMNSNSDQDQDSRVHHFNSAQENQEDGKFRLPPRDKFGHSGFEGGICEQMLKDFLMASQEKHLEELSEGKSSGDSVNDVNIFRGTDGAKYRHTNIFQGADISEFHPWEVITGRTQELKPRYLLSITSSDKVRRRTRDGCFWKQTGPAYTKPTGLSCKYFSYKYKRGHCSQEKKKDSWTLHEYSLTDDSIREIAEKKGIEQSDRIGKFMILRIARGGKAAPDRHEEDDQLSLESGKHNSTTHVPEWSECLRPEHVEQGQASSDCPFDDVFLCHNDLPQSQTSTDSFLHSSTQLAPTNLDFLDDSLDVLDDSLWCNIDLRFG